MSDPGRPPRNSSPVLSATGSQMSSRSTSVGSRNSSNTPSGSAANENGVLKLDKQRCSVLCHPLGLPLVSAFHGEDPRKLPHLGQESKFFSSTGEDNHSYDNVLKSAVDKWRTSKGPKGNKLETHLTSILTKLIQDTVCNDETSLEVQGECYVGNASKPKGRVDITLCNVSGEPLMFLEVGRQDANWWKKFDQAAKYVKMKYEETEGVHHEPFTGPLLLAVMTIVDAKQSKQGDEEVAVKLGVFLCTKKKKERRETEQQQTFRMSLLWHSNTSTLKDGSDAFGRLLRRVCDFSSWLATLDDAQNESDYAYLSSNCCRVGDHVFRSYDSRVRPTTRSPVIYLSKGCRAIVGGEATVILNLQGNLVASSDDKDDDFWTAGRTLKVIMTPYRHGNHVARKPTSFLSIIDLLEQLHKKGFVHGDIRGFNTVFGEDGEGCLIDFDFGGKAGRAQYPNGYRQALLDGKRFVDNHSRIIQKWHDWYALGRLIFEVYDIMPPKGNHDADTRLQIYDLHREWKAHHATPEMIKDLGNFLTRIDKAGWTVQPNETYQHELDRIYGRENAGMEGTNACATGSPPKG